MPEKRTLKRAQKDKREGKAATTQAGEFVREEMEHKKEHKHPVKNRKQAIAIGLSKARRAGVKIGPNPKKKSAAKKKSASKRSSSTSKKSSSTRKRSTSTKRKSTARKKSTAKKR